MNARDGIMVTAPMTIKHMGRHLSDGTVQTITFTQPVSLAPGWHRYEDILRAGMARDATAPDKALPAPPQDREDARDG